MSRSAVTLRAARPGDAAELVRLWTLALRRTDASEQQADIVSVIDRAEAADDEAVVVAELDGRLAGAVHLSITTVTPINLEPMVVAVSPQVFPEFRRHGVGTALLEAAVEFAEANGVGHLGSGAVSGDRVANRFLARLALAPQALLRVGATHAVRAKLTPMTKARPVTEVLRRRRFQRRVQTTAR